MEIVFIEATHCKNCPYGEALVFSIYYIPQIIPKGSGKEVGYCGDDDSFILGARLNLF
jgi:hypothetical protein